MLPGEEGPPAPRGCPRPKGAPPAAPSPGLGGPLPRGRRAEAKPRSWRLRRGRLGVNKGRASRHRETPSHVAAPASSPAGATYRAARHGRKGRAPGRPSLRGAWAASTRRQPTKKFPKPRARPAPPGPAPSRARPQSPEALACPLPAARGRRGGPLPWSPSPVSEAADSGKSTPDTSLGVVSVYLLQVRWNS